jgi:putative peptidoglycan lipid II flippase
MLKNQQFGRRMLTVSTGIFSSRVLGLARDVAFAYVFGTGRALAAFVIAFTFPNLLRALLGEGAFNNVFVPVFNAEQQRSGRAAAWAQACRVISVLAMVVAVLVFVVSTGVALARPWVSDELGAQVLRLTPILMPFALLICVSGALGGILNSVDRFAVAAYSPVIMNVCLIGGALLFSRFGVGDGDGNGGWTLAAAVLLAGVLQLLWHVLACRREGLVVRFDPVLGDPAVGRVARLMAPVLIGTGVVQLNVVVDRVLAGVLGSAATTSLYYSQRLVYLPVSLFGVAMGTVVLPSLSRTWAAGDVEGMRRSVGKALKTVLFLSVPSVALLAALRYPVVRLLFQRGGFDGESTRETVWALLFYLPGVPVFACAKVAVTPFYARQDTRTPVRIAAWCLGLNVVLNLVLMQFLAQGGLALATSICSFVNVGVLLILAFRRMGGGGLSELTGRALRMIFAGAIVFLVASTVLGWLPAGDGLFAKVMHVVVPGLVGACAYLFVCAALLRDELLVLMARKG